MTTGFRGSDSALITAFVLAAALGPARPAVAQSASAQAEAMFNEGRSLLDAGRVGEACAAFESSQRLGPATSTLLNLAACRERNGQLATAWGLFLDVGRATRGASDPQSKKWHQLALDRAKRLEPRLSKLTIKVSDDSRVDRLDIVRGTESIDAAMWNRALPIDGGRYQIRARAPGAPPWTVEVTVAAEGDAKVVEVPRLGSPGAPIVGAANAAKARAPETTSAVPSAAVPAASPREAAGASPSPATRDASRPVASAPPAASRDATSAAPAVPRDTASGTPSSTRDAARSEAISASRAPTARDAASAATTTGPVAGAATAPGARTAASGAPAPGPRTAASGSPASGARPTSSSTAPGPAANASPAPTRDVARGDAAIAARTPTEREASPSADAAKAPSTVKTPDTSVPLASNESSHDDLTPSSRPWLPMAVAGGGVVLLGGATGFYLWGSSSYNAAHDEQRDQRRRDSLENDANGRRHIAMVVGVAGLACGGVAAWLYFHERAEQPSTTSTSASLHMIRDREHAVWIRTVVPVVADGGAGVAILGAF